MKELERSKNPSGVSDTEEGESRGENYWSGAKKQCEGRKKNLVKPKTTTERTKQHKKKKN